MNTLQVLTLDSREVAKMMEKRHADLLRDITVNSEYLSSAIQRKIALNELNRRTQFCVLLFNLKNA